MDLPSMVQRSGNTLVVRSLVSGNQLFTEETAATTQATSTNPSETSNNNNNNNNNITNNNNHNLIKQIEATKASAMQQLSNGNNNNSNKTNNEEFYGNNNNNNNNNNINMNNQNNQNATAAVLEQQMERFRAAALAQQQQMLAQNDATTQQQQQLEKTASQNLQQLVANNNSNTNSSSSNNTLESKDEGLPQCKIKRNYSCSYCTYFTQNPRSHLMHLRDVHGEKIVINKCKLCLYASRHFQKLVRHMKMVHGCTDGIPGGNGQARGKRGMSRDLRRRRLEESVGIVQGGQHTAAGNNGSNAVNLLQSLREMPTLEQLKRELQLQEQKLQRQQHQHQQQQHQQQQTPQSTPESYIMAAIERQLLHQAQQMRQSPSEQTQQRQPPAAHQQAAAQSAVAPTTPSPSGSGSASTSPPTIDALYITPLPASSNAQAAHEQTQNRLLKCSVCEFTTLYADDLIEHERLEHCKTKFFRCEKCSYVTHIKARYSKHVKYHSMPMIKCVTCDFRTPYKWNLDRHMKNHGGAGPFKCAACDFTADIKQSLTVHEMNHHVPPVGHAAGMSLTRRRNKVGGTDLPDEFLSDSAELLDDQFNNNMDEYEEALLSASDAYGKRKYDQDDEPTDLSQKGGGSASDTSSVHNQPIGASTPKRGSLVGNLMQLPKLDASALNLSSRDLASRSALTDIASMFFNEKQLSELWSLGKQQQQQQQAAAAQLSPTATITSSASTASHSSQRNTLQQQQQQQQQKKSADTVDGASSMSGGGSLFEKLKASALNSNGSLNGNLICPCGHIAKCLSESILHRKACTFAATVDDDDDMDEAEEPDDGDDGRLEIDCANDDDDKQSHSALNLSVSGSTRCQHCRHRCKSSADLLQHLRHCAEAMGSNESYDSMSGESNAMGSTSDWPIEQQHPVENRVFIWNKLGGKGSESNQSGGGSGNHGGGNHGNSSSLSGSTGGSILINGSNEEYSYCGIETAPGYGEVTKKLSPEEEATSSSLKKVFKCPHCSFWASTASRFHVHIVGHLNKKPFECSLCAYRSNWRWDITKHIRLKTIRDPSHKNARVLMNDETGRRNYTKYNKYITLMKVTEEDGDPKLMKSGEMTPNQVASLAFINDLNKSASGASGSSGLSLAQQLSSMQNITLEPVVQNKLDENDLIRLPLIATIVNAALAEQQQQQKQQESAMITPSVTISAVKRSSPPLAKPTDDLITEIRQEGNEKRTSYRCRKCNFRHNNRDAVLAHVKIHYQDPNYPIVTATLTSSSGNKQNQQQQPLHATPFMNKVLAAMCLQQTQNTDNTPNQSQQQQHSIPFTAELLQQAMQGGNSSTFNSLALALAGKLPQQQQGGVKPTASLGTAILEHGEQNASQNEASAPSMTSHTRHAATPTASTSLQDLLTSPRGTFTNRLTAATATNGGDGVGCGAINNNKQNNLNPNNTSLVTGNKNGGGVSQNGPAAASASNGSQNDVTTTSTPTPTTSSSGGCLKNGAGVCSNFKNVLGAHHGDSANSPTNSTSKHNLLTNQQMNSKINLTNLNNDCSNSSTSSSTSSLLSNSNASTTLSSNLLLSLASSGISSNATAGTTTNEATQDNATPTAEHHGDNNGDGSAAVEPTASASSTMSQRRLLLTQLSNQINQNSNSASNIKGNSSSSCSNSNRNQLIKLNNGNSSNNNSGPHLLTHDSIDRRDPSPYRCGHCHQVSNWKHVIQRHCRLKHAGDIRIETIDRAATNEQHSAVYRSLGNSATNETSYNNNNTPQNNTTTNNNNNAAAKQQQLSNVLNSFKSNSNNNKSDTGVPTSQDLQAAAVAYLYTAYKVAAASGTANPDDLLQLQQNDQIEITRLPASANANLAQLLEQSAGHSLNNNSNNQQQQANSKSKQQKCPLCPYISESKSQMNYHISLHKPSQYQCDLCTFVCAKKQHLSNHMRQQHQQQQQQQQQQHGTNAALTALTNGSLAGFNLDMALQLAVQQVQQQQNSCSALSAIDLTALKQSLQPILQPQQQHQQQPSAEVEHVRTILYCSKCPARFVQQPLGEPNKAKLELDAHLLAHNHHNTELQYQCDFCDFRALHETQIQAHYYVHTQHYQHKFNELNRHSRDHEGHRPPKLIQMTMTRSMGREQMSDTVWIVDQELTARTQQQQQNVSSTTTAFDGGNSLLKKQLEAGPAAVTTRTPSPVATNKTMSSAVPETDDSTTNSSSVLPATSVASLASSEPLTSPQPGTVAETQPAALALEKCLYCPFETTQLESYKAHLQRHICISNKHEEFTCDHCDYSAASKEEIDQHTPIHFNAMERLKDVAFYTSYDKLELSVEQPMAEAEKEQSVAAAEPQPQPDLVIKREHSLTPPPAHNNNNEEDVVNENTRQQPEEFNGDSSVPNKEQPVSNKRKSTDDASELNKRPCNKIILYKNDGFLSVKKNLTISGSNDPQCDKANEQRMDVDDEQVAKNNDKEMEEEKEQQHDNISERLRRRISSLRDTKVQEQQEEEQQQQVLANQKPAAILVNAKTGEIINKQ